MSFQKRTVPFDFVPECPEILVQWIAPGTTFSEVSFIPENLQWNEPKSRVRFISQPEFPDFFGKWTTSRVFGQLNNLRKVIEIREVGIECYNIYSETSLLDKEFGFD